MADGAGTALVVAGVGLGIGVEIEALVEVDSALI
jgi:hypothetical protein